MGRYYNRVPIKAPDLRVLIQDSNNPARFEWVKPSQWGHGEPVINCEDGSYIPVKF